MERQPWGNTRPSMQKHAALTLSRIHQFAKALEESMKSPHHALQIEFCEVPHASEKAARTKGPWAKVEKGFKYGPAYQVKWIRVTGKVPAEMTGKSVYASLEVGGERTLWKDDSPIRGIDDPHPLVPLFPEATGGEKIDLCLQVYTRNPSCRVHGKELPREDLVETVDHAALLTIDEDLKALHFDLDYAHHMLKGLAESDPGYQTLLRATNEVCNLFDPASKETLARCRKLIKDALTNLGGEIPHQIYAFGHAHLDTAWLWPISITKLKMAHTTSTQLDLIERYPEYVYVHSQASQYEWLELEFPKLFARVQEATKLGKWEPVGSMWVEADCNLTGAESLVRQFLYGKRYFKDKLGTDTIDMFLPDVFGYSAALPQILNKFGIRAFLTQKISWNQTNKFPHNSFLWQGIDGTKIWSHFPPADTYIGSCEPPQILESVKKHRDHGRSDASMYLFGWGDGGGGPTERHLEFLRRARQTSAMPEIPAGKKAADFYREAPAKSKDLAVWVGELYLEYHRGTYTSQANNKKWNRESEFLMRDAELLSCFTPGYPKSYPAAELERLWKLVLLNQFHDIIPGSSVREVYEDSDKDYAEILLKGTQITEAAIRTIAAQLDSQHTEIPIALFQNSEVPGLASLPWESETAPNSILCGDESLPVQVCDTFGHKELVFPMPNAALGTVAIGDLRSDNPESKFRLKASNRKIENAFLSVKFDANGNITSIESLEDGTEFVQPGKLANLFQIFEDKPLFWSAWDIDPYAFETGKDLIRSERFEIVERGPVRVTAELEKRIGKSTIRQRISLGPSPLILFDTEIDWHEEDKLLKVAFPVNVNASKATCEIQFGSVERPTHQNTSWDAAKFEVCAQKWVDLSEGDHGMALLNDGKYGHDFRGNVMRLSLLRAPKAPDPLCDMGVHRFRYSLMPHFGPHQYAGVVAASYMLNAKPWALPIQQSQGEAGLLPVLVQCEDRNLIIESVKKAEEGDALIVRVYECHNARGAAELSCARPIRAAYLCTLDEKPESELELHEGAVMFPYSPFEILTLRLEL